MQGITERVENMPLLPVSDILIRKDVGRWSHYRNYHQENEVTRIAEGLANYDIKTNGWKGTNKGSIQIKTKNAVLMKSATPTLK